MAKLVVRKDEISWVEPKEYGCRTQYTIEKVADHATIAKQLVAYEKRGYIRRVSMGEKVYLSPLLPVLKPDGRVRFTTDFINKYFNHEGTTQVDVWRKLREIDKSWRFFMEIDLKDGFFGIPIERELSKLFGFTFGQDRYVWMRLPQGWLWSSILFCERIHEILHGIPGVPQYSDNVLVGAKTPQELKEKAIRVFERFDKYGLKVNFNKVKWSTAKINFLGYEIENGKMSLKTYLKKKMEQLGRVRNVNDLERIIGIISYARHFIKATELILAPLRSDLKDLKKGRLLEKDLEGVNLRVEEAFKSVHSNILELSVLGLHPTRFMLETDWSQGHVGYMLFAILSNGQKCLVDIGSKTNVYGSSYLGELKGIVWACRQTKAYRGSIPLTIISDANGIHDKERKRILVDDDCRSFRRWAWLMANEPGFELTFLPGEKNMGADLLSRKDKKIQALKHKTLLIDNEKWAPGRGEFFVKEQASELQPACGMIRKRMSKREMKRKIWEEHKVAHLGPWKVWKALKRQDYHVPLKLVRSELKFCQICAKYRDEYPRGKWRSLLYSENPGEIVYADVIGPLPTGRRNNRFIQSVIDSATRLGNATAHVNNDVASLIRGLKNWIDKNGNMKILLTDNAASYTSREMSEWCTKKNIEHRFNAPYRHQSMGIIERYNKTLQKCLKKVCLERGGNWVDHLQFVVNTLNNSVSEATGYSPRDLWEGDIFKRREAKKKADKRREQNNRQIRKVKPINLRVGQIVIVRDYESFKSNKFAPLWRGPYKLIEKISNSYWKGELLNERKSVIRKPVSIFHCDQIQPFFNNSR